VTVSRRIREPLQTTVLRTGGIALVAGLLLALAMGHVNRWPVLTLAVLWFSLGGHWLELWFLNWLGPRLPAARRLQVAARIVVWFTGGILLGLGATFTAGLADYRLVRSSAWWFAGVAFVGAELLLHLWLQLRARPSFYNGRA
jgi:hypothetical protein